MAPSFAGVFECVRYGKLVDLNEWYSNVADGGHKNSSSIRFIEFKTVTIPSAIGFCDSNAFAFAVFTYLRVLQQQFNDNRDVDFRKPT